ncbi:MAG: hypothetical protein IPM93_23515 [Candidatus Obscuribacter sp.]|nr:hypothetical protein [Candidatus Obscuribacter sp.]
MPVEPQAAIVALYLKQELVDETIIFGKFKNQKELPQPDLLGPTNSLFSSQYRRLANNQLRLSGMRNSLFNVAPSELKAEFEGLETDWVCNIWSEKDSAQVSLLRFKNNSLERNPSLARLMKKHGRQFPWRVKSVSDNEQVLFGTLIDGRTLILSVSAVDIEKASAQPASLEKDLIERIAELKTNETEIGAFQFLRTGNDSDPRFSRLKVPSIDVTGRETGSKTLPIDGISMVARSSYRAPVIKYSLLAGKMEKFHNFSRLLETLVFRAGDKYELSFDDAKQMMTLTCNDVNSEVLLNKCFGNLILTALELE